MYFLKNLSDWETWRYVFDRHEHCAKPMQFPCFAYISADGSGREALYLYQTDLWQMLGQMGVAK